MRVVACLSFALLLGAAPAPPQRIVSLNLCADELLVVLADPGQIAALTTLSRDPAMSTVARTARRYPAIRGSVEEVMARRPDLVVAYPGRDAAAFAPRGGRPPRLLDLPPADDYPTIERQIRDVAAAVGHPERGAALVARMAAGLRALPPPRRRGVVVAHYQRRGYLTGTGTLVDDLLRRLGAVNLAARLGRPPLSHLSVEELVAARPDYLLVEDDSTRVVDQGTELLVHPALARIPRLHVPQAAIVCGGPGYVAAAQGLARQLR